MNDSQKFDKKLKIKQSIGQYDNFCDGYYGNNNQPGKSYVLGTVLAGAVTDVKLSHPGSTTLDEINAFDKAEVANTNIGKINLITVSSFCGPQGLILGFDVLRSKEFEKYTIRDTAYGNKKLYSLDPLLNSTRALLGTVTNQRFPILPGAHVPCAGKNITAEGPCTLYSGLAIGIAGDGSTQNALLMEDVGFIKETPKEQLIDNLIKSVIEVGNNQKTEYHTIFSGIQVVTVPEHMIGCALVAAPYLLLPKKAVGSLEQFNSIDLETWVSDTDFKK